MAMQMQSLLVTPVSAAYVNGSKLTGMAHPIGFNPRMGNRVNFSVKCKAERKPEGEPKIDPNLPSSDDPITMPEIRNTPSLKPQPNASTDFTDVFAFDGPAPERINGRLAMIGFVAAIAVEAAKGTDLFSQIAQGGGQWFLGTSILLSVASLVPLFKGLRPEAKTEGVMNSNAELWNGRFAMLGLVALAFTEYVKGGALV